MGFIFEALSIFFVKITKKILTASTINPSDISCIATSAIGPCMLPVSYEGDPLMNAVLYGVDTRAENEIRELNEEVGEEKILQNCGNALTSQSVGPKILWLKKNCPEIFKKAGKILSSTSFLVQKLTGESVIDHYTAANFTPLYDIKNLKWTDALTKNIIEIERLPKLMWTTEIAGYVSKAASKETGLATGIPVTVGTIDAAAEAISVGVSSAGDMMMMYGSTIFTIQVTNEKIIDPVIQTACKVSLAHYPKELGFMFSQQYVHDGLRPNMRLRREHAQQKIFEIFSLLKIASNDNCF